MTFHVVVLCCVTLFLLLVSALVSGSETAFFSLSGNDVRKIRRHDTPVCRRMLNLLGKADLLLATILVVNNLVNIGIVILSSEIIDSLFTFARFEFLFKTVIVTFLLLLFGEILPKVAAQTIPLRFAGFAARPLLVLRWIFYPLSYVLVRTGNRISERAAHHQEISIGELADAIDMTRTASKEEHGMLSGIVSFVNTEVQEIMKPRVDITAVPSRIPMNRSSRPSSGRVSRAFRFTRAIWTISRERFMSRICFRISTGATNSAGSN